MDDFLFQIQELIARNKIQQVIKILLETFQKCESSNPASKDEMRDLRNQVVLLSARYNDTTDKINSGIISPLLADTAKNQLISAFLNITSKLPDYEEFSNYINGLEEEEAWQAAVKANNIETYRIFFSQHPNSKYKEETQRVISELEAIQKEKEREIKQKAEEEKTRRVIEEKKQRAAARLKKEKEEKARLDTAAKIKREQEKKQEQKDALAKQQKEKEELVQKERERQEELDSLKKQLAEKEREQKEREQEDARKDAQREKERSDVLSSEQKAKENLARIEAERKKELAKKGKARREEHLRKEAERKAAKETSKPLATVSAATGIAAGEQTTPTIQPSFFSNLFSKQHIWWTLLPFTVVPILSWLSFQSMGFNFLVLTSIMPIAYAVIAYKFPLKKQAYSLLSIGIASLVLFFIFSIYGLSSMSWLAPFVVSAIIVNIILYSRNNSLTDKQVTPGKTAVSKHNKPLTASYVPTSQIPKPLIDQDTTGNGLFSKQKIWWTILPFTLAPFVPWLLNTFERELGDGVIMFSLALLPLAYGIISYKFPLKQQVKSLISTGLASLIFVISVSLTMPYNRSAPDADELFYTFMGGFAFLAAITNIILYFRNKALAKE